jgi:prepilin-type processing-associated H-X9-DG protein
MYIPAKEYQLKLPSKTLAFCDSRNTTSGNIDEGNYGVSSWYVATGGVGGLVYARHAKAINIGWADGHVASTKCANPLNPYPELGSVSGATQVGSTSYKNIWDRSNVRPASF